MNIIQFIKEHSLPKYRIKQFDQFLYRDIGSDFNDFTTWPKGLREELIDQVDIMSLDVEKRLVSERKDTIKVLFKRKHDSQRIESVLMRHKDGRNTVCVSCMVGCPVNCSFCATGKMGFGGNLSTKEIVDQVLYFARYLKTVGSKLNGKDKISNIVFMGMGEPMLNLRNVQGAIDTFTSEDKLGMSSRRITISTSGYIPQLKKFINDGFRGRIAISLHAPNQELRQKMMPVAKKYSLYELLDTLDEYTRLTNKRVTYEYIMIKGLNDKDNHARQLVHLFKDRLAHINLIPYNPIREASFKRSEKSQMTRFTKILDDNGIPHSIRFTMGDDVNAACGQLADRANKKHIKNTISV